MSSALLLTGLCTATAAVAAMPPCTLRHLPIEPAAPGRTDVFVGRATSIQLEFKNGKTEGEIDSFPEPPLVVRTLASGKTCEIDGGIWLRKSVFVGSGDRLIVTHEFSGSNDSLNFYDASTCEKTTEIDTTHADWSVAGSRITVSMKKTAHRPRRAKAVTYRLDAACHPIKSLK